MAATSSPLTGSGQSGATCQKSGPYSSNRNAKVTVFFAKGQVFPPDVDGATTTWTLANTATLATNAQAVS